MTALYESWNEAGGDWTKSKIYLEARNTNSKKKTGRRVWLTKAEMEAKFGIQGCEAIIATKEGDATLKSSQVRPHPEAPTCLALTQYFCLDMDAETEEEEEVINRLFKAAEDDDEDSDSSDKTASESSKDSSSSDKKGKKRKKENLTRSKKKIKSKKQLTTFSAKRQNSNFHAGREAKEENSKDQI